MEKMINEGVSFGDLNIELERIIHNDIIQTPQIREIYLGAWEKSGVTCANTCLWPPGAPGLSGAVEKIAESKNRIDNIKDIIHVLCADDIKKAKNNGIHSVLWNFENANVIGGGFDIRRELSNLDLIYYLGIRVLSLTYNYRNFIGDGYLERYQSGLSHFGIKVVERMNQLGMLIDVSHCGYQTTIDAVEVSKVPIAITHTASRSLSDNSKCKTDEEFCALTEKNGYIGVCMRPQFLGIKNNLNDFLDHLDYIIELVGVKHVGIGTANAYRPFGSKKFPELNLKGVKNPISGSDWWLSGKYVRSLEALDAILNGSMTWINWPYFTVALVNRGYSDKEIKQIIGGNFLNIIETVVG
jgi:membrane dipeptidase